MSAPLEPIPVDLTGTTAVVTGGRTEAKLLWNRVQEQLA